MPRLSNQLSHLLTQNILKILNQRKVFTVNDFLEHEPEFLAAILKISFKDIVLIRSSLLTDCSAYPHTGISLYNDLIANSALIQSGINSLDSILDGGFMTGNLYELCGFSGAGKTQICFSTVAHVTSNLKQNVYYIDTNLSFSGERMQSLLDSRGYNDEDMGLIMNRIKVINVSNIYKLFAFLNKWRDNLQELREDSNVRLIIIDSLPPLFYTFYGDSHNDGLAQMNHLSNFLRYIAQEHHVIFLLVNMATRFVEADWPLLEGKLRTPNDEAKNTTNVKPALGKYWLHVPNTRLLVEKKPCNPEAEITVVKSVNIPLGKSCKVNLNCL